MRTQPAGCWFSSAGYCVAFSYSTDGAVQAKGASKLPYRRGCDSRDPGVEGSAAALCRARDYQAYSKRIGLGKADEGKRGGDGEHVGGRLQTPLPLGTASTTTKGTFEAITNLADPTSCQDEDLNCAAWAAAGHCGAFFNPTTPMRVYCCASCAGVGASRAKCEDADRQCEVLAAGGHCKVLGHFCCASCTRRERVSRDLAEHACSSTVVGESECA